MEGARPIKEVFHIIEREGAKTLWNRIGIGFVNKDESITIRLDAIPLTGVLQVRNMRSTTQRKEA